MPAGRILMLALKILVLGVVPLLLVSGCVLYHMHDGGPDLRAIFGDDPPRIGVLEHDGRAIRYAETGDPRKPLVLFVHGSPGAWHNFARFLADPLLRRRAHLVAVDRPGYGGSGRGCPEPSLERQAEDLLGVLDLDRSGAPAVLVGHSYGGPVVARMAMEIPARVGGLVLAAPSIDPTLEERHWYQTAGSLAPVRWLLPAGLDVSNQEVLPLRRHLEAMLPLWARITARVIVIQGDRDVLVSPRNADFARRVLVNAPLTVDRLPEANHFLPWTHADHIRRAVLDLLDRLE